MNPSPKRARTMVVASETAAAVSALEIIKLGVSAAEIESRTDEIIGAHSSVWDPAKITAAVEEHSDGKAPRKLFEASFLALASADDEAALASSGVTLPSVISPSLEERDAATVAKRRLKGLWSKADANPTIAAALTRAAGIIDAAEKQQGVAVLSEQERRLVQVMLTSCARAGALLTDAGQRARVTELADREAALCGAFEQNINEDTSSVALSAAELDGLPESFVKDLPQAPPSSCASSSSSDDHRLLVGLKAPQCRPVLLLAESAETRRRVLVASASRCAASNGPILEELVALRHERSTLLGFPSHAAYMLDEKMAGTPARARELLLSIRDRLQPQRARELARLREIKCEREGGDDADDAAAAGRAPELHEWDTAFYARLLKERDYAIDQELVRQHFPLPRVKREVFALFEKLLHVTIRRVVKPSAETHAAEAAEEVWRSEQTEESPLAELCWHEDVELYVMREESLPEGRGALGRIVGHFFLDLHPRPGKYGHQCVLPIAPAFRRIPRSSESSAVHVAAIRPVCAILGNMSGPPTDGSTPALLRFDEVKTFMHEFGHVVHCLLTDADHSTAICTL